MVMATGSVCQQISACDLSHDASEVTDDASAEATALHERLVAYVHALAGGHEPRSGVWVEHSYARARGAAHAPAAHVRVLLAPRLSAELGDVDVERADPPQPVLPAASPPPDDGAGSDPECDSDWEARVSALAPSAAHARLADRALDTLRRMRLERLAASPEAARAAARRLRLALAAAAAHPTHPAPGAWLHHTLLACTPRAVRRLYDELAAELHRAAPRLAERVLGGPAPPPRPDPLAAVGQAVGDDVGPWLVWLGCGRAKQDERWRRRLGALLHVRVLAADSAACAPPDAWCAAVAGSVRAALADTLAEAGERPVILGGVGAGAALCTALASAAGGGRVRGLLLLAPPLLTAEGARDTPDDPLAELRLPMLVVVGTGAAASWRGAAREVARGEAARRVLELRGADDALRLPAGVRRRRRLPQHALDAAVAEECARWATETALGSGGESPVRERPRRRTGLRGERVLVPDERVLVSDERVLVSDDDEEYAHLPSASRATPAVLTVPSAGSDRPSDAVGECSGRLGVLSSLEATRSVTLAEGRVVSRGSGGTPLALLPPRRAASPSPSAAPPLAPADIMRLPIVFADDEPAPERPDGEPAASPVTVTAGSRAHAYTRVIVASRGGRPVRPGAGAAVRPGAGAAVRPGAGAGVRPGAGATVRPGAGATVRPGAGATVRPGAGATVRPVLLRRGLRLVPRAERPH